MVSLRPVLMPLRAFFDSDAVPTILYHAAIIGLNALAGIF